MENISFEEIMKSECGSCFGGYGFDLGCEDCELKNRCKKLKENLDTE